MTTTEAFLNALTQPLVNNKYPNPTVRNWKSRAKRDMLSVDFMIDFLLENGYELKQVMQWDKALLTATDNGSVAHVNVLVNHNGDVMNEKMQLLKKLYDVRKQMDPESLAKWFNWCIEQYASDYPERRFGISEAAFYQMTSGRHISKANTLFAIKLLKEGKRLQEEYNALIRSEIESL